MVDVKKHNEEADQMRTDAAYIERVVHRCMCDLDKLDGEQRRAVLKRLMVVYGESRLVAP